MMKMVKKALVLVLLVVVLAAVAVVGWNVWMSSKESVKTMSTGISSYINDIGELATAEYGFTMANTASKPHKEVAGFKIPFTESKVIYSYEGLIKAGVDFADIGISVDDAAKTISISLPEARILSKAVDRDSLIVYDEKNSPFNSFTFEDMNLSEAALENAAEEAAVENGLLDRATESAKVIIRSMVGNLYDLNEYAIAYK